MIARYMLWREVGVTHAQARALADADYVILGWAVAS